jgi:hypothetical protein
MTLRLSSVCLIAAATCLTAVDTPAQEPGIPAFKSSVERVTVAATVRDSQGRPITSLEAPDFELFDDAMLAPSSASGPSPVPQAWRS